MRVSIISILALALSVSASPLIGPQITSIEDITEIADGNQEVGNAGQNAGNSASNRGKVAGDFTVEQAVQTCGNAQLNCCNKVEKKGDTTNAGVLGSVFGSGDLGVQCSPVNVAALAGEYSSPLRSVGSTNRLNSPGSRQQSLRCKGSLLPRGHRSGIPFPSPSYSAH